MNEPLPDDTAPRPLSWELPGGGHVTAQVYGGYRVSTEDLLALAHRLRTAASHVDSAYAAVLTSTAQVRAVNPVWFPDQAPPGRTPGRVADFPAQTSLTGQRHRLSADERAWWIEALDPTDQVVSRRRALDSLEGLTAGHAGLRGAALRLRTLASDLEQAAERYTDAEVRTGQNWGADVAGLVGFSNALWARLSAGGPGVPGAPGGRGPSSLSRSAARAAGEAIPEESQDRLLREVEKVLPDSVRESLALDVIWHLRTVLADQALEGWVLRDLVAIVALSVHAQRAHTSQEAAQVESYLRLTAARLDPVLARHLPEQMYHGSQLVRPDTLNPMQRVTAYLAIASAGAGERRFGRRTGVRVTPRGGLPVTVPPGGTVPFGLAASLVAPPLAQPLVPALTGPGSGVGSSSPAITSPGANRTPGAPVQARDQARLREGVARLTGAAPNSGQPRVVQAPSTPSEVMRYSDSLKKQDADISTGVLSILRTDHADGHRSWLVVVPGTTDWGTGGSNPQDMLTNLEAVAGIPTDMESAVVTAMRTSGIEPHDPVAIYGHSQGAITAANVAADPAVGSQFRFTAALTVGGPVSPVALPDSVQSLHIENGADAVTALDAAPNPVLPHRTTVLLDTTGSGLEGYPHGSLVYADAMEAMPTDPAVDAWNARLRAITGAGEAGAVTQEIVFDVERLTQPRQPAP